MTQAPLRVEHTYPNPVLNKEDKMLVRQILKSKADDGVVTIGPDASVADAANLLSTRRIGSVVVSVDGKVAQGILS